MTGAAAEGFATAKDVAGPIDRDVVHVPGQTNQATPVGLNKPLRIVIKDVFTGDCDPGEVLLTTAVKSSASFEAQPLALQATHKLSGGRTHLPFRAADPGSPVVYYTDAALDRELLVDVRMDFDRFDQDRFNKYVEIIGKAGALPVFAGASILGGPAAGAGAAAAIFAVQRGIRIIARAFDRWKDGPGNSPADLSTTFSVNLDSIDSLPTSAGYYLCSNDGSGLVLPPEASDLRDGKLDVVGDSGREFRVNGQGKLTYPDGRRVDDLYQAYILLHISGAEDDSLRKFEATAATAALLKKFVGGEGSAVEDLVELAEAYNDFVFLNRVSDLDGQLRKTKDAGAKTKLQEERDAVLKHIQSDVVKGLLTA